MHYVRLPILPTLPEVARCIYRFRGECRRTRNFDCSEFNERNECQTKMTKEEGREGRGGSWVMLTVGGLISCAICQLGLFLALSPSSCLFLYLLPMHIKTIPSPFLLPRLVSPGSPVLPCWLAEAFHFRRCRHFSNQMRKQCKTRGQKFPLKCNRCKLEEGRQKSQKKTKKI